jgi:LacI family transcriptional regulator
MSRSGQQGVPLDVGIRDVARHAGVAVGTVSNVLNRPEAVGAATRERVLDAIAALGFVRNESARHLRAGSSRTLGLVVLDVANPFFTDVARGVDDVAAEHGLAVLLCNSDDQPRRESDQLGLLLEQRVQGVVITPTAELSPALDTVRRRGVPLVLLDRRAPTADQCSVAVDDELGGRLAAEHLLEAGHRRIAFVGGTTPLPQLQERLTGVRTAVRERTGDDDALTVLSPASLTVAGGREAAQQLLGIPAARRPTAAVCANDLLALGMLQELVRHGVDVPGEVALVGYDDIEFAAAAAVPLTSVRKPRADLGRLAASMVLEEASDPGHVHRQVVLDPVLVVRESSAGRAGVRRGEGIA